MMAVQTASTVRELDAPEFAVTHGKGFHIRFENGWTVSVQWGCGNYSSNYSSSEYRERDHSYWPAATAEVAAWNTDGKWHRFGRGKDADSVSGYLTPAQVVAFINRIARKKATA